MSGKKFLLKTSILKTVIVFCFIIYSGCHKANNMNGAAKVDKSGSQITVYEDKPVYVKFKSFQNLDSTWGFTIFVNSRPFLHYKKIPVERSSYGFESRKDAETVAGMFVKMIRNGNTTPSIDLKALDTLGITIRNRKNPG